MIACVMPTLVSINVQTGEALDTHSLAVLLGVGATTINPYMAIDSIFQRFEKGLFGKKGIMDPEDPNFLNNIQKLKNSYIYYYQKNYIF